MSDPIVYELVFDLKIHVCQRLWGGASYTAPETRKFKEVDGVESQTSSLCGQPTLFYQSTCAKRIRIPIQRKSPVCTTVRAGLAIAASLQLHHRTHPTSRTAKHTSVVEPNQVSQSSKPGARNSVASPSQSRLSALTNSERPGSFPLQN